MNVTFLVSIDVADISALPSMADDIKADLEDSGFDVQSVAPWARANVPTAAPGGGFASLQTPSPITPTL